jgi:hypothetical protein
MPSAFEDNQQKTKEKRKARMARKAAAPKGMAMVVDPGSRAILGPDLKRQKRCP